MDARAGLRQITPLSDTFPQFTMADAQAVSLRLRALRLDAGEVPKGRKIGFTNSTIWKKYNITGPIWGDVWDDTLAYLDSETATVALPHLTEPRIEPEIVFGFSSTPSADMDDAALMKTIDWAAHGFEVVFSPYPGWRFVAPDCMAGFGLHGKLFIGPQHELAELGPDPVATLSALTCDLYCGKMLIGTGRGEYVLGGPVQALRFLLDAIQGTDHPLIQPGDVVTTGTLLDGHEMQPGETWRTQIHGAPFEPLTVTFT